MGETAIISSASLLGGLAISSNSGYPARSRVAGDVAVQATGLDPQERRQVAALKRRDQEVRAHEQAHKSAAGQYAGGISYSFRRGPDGRHYAVGGEVSIDVAPVVGDPRATIDKMEQVQRAALAPVQPSSHDRAIAAQAARQSAKAKLELAQERREGEPGASTDKLQRRLAPDSGDEATMGRNFSANA